MTQWWYQLIKRFNRQAVAEEVQQESPKEPKLDQIVDNARKDWLQARAYFENVTDPDLIDHAIYEIVAAERKYMYLLRLAREQHQSAPGPNHDVDPTEPRLQVPQLESSGQPS